MTFFSTEAKKEATTEYLKDQNLKTRKEYEEEIKEYPNLEGLLMFMLISLIQKKIDGQGIDSKFKKLNCFEKKEIAEELVLSVFSSLKSFNLIQPQTGFNIKNFIVGETEGVFQIRKKWLDSELEEGAYSSGESVEGLNLEKKTYVIFGIKGKELIGIVFDLDEEDIPNDRLGAKRFKNHIPSEFEKICDNQVNAKSQGPTNDASSTLPQTFQDKINAAPPVLVDFKNPVNCQDSAKEEAKPQISVNANSQNSTVPSSQSSFMKNLFIAFGLILVSLILFFIFKK